MTWTIDNFCDVSPIEIKASSHPSPDIGAIVDIQQSWGAMRFSHAMRPEQARELAAILLTVADEAERLEAEREREEVAA